MEKLSSPPNFTCTAATETTTSEAAVVRRSANYPPSPWDHQYLLSLENIYAKQSEAKEKAKLLKNEVMKMLSEIDTEDSVKQLELIDSVQRLGVSYHFEHEIANILMKIRDESRKNIRKAYMDEDLHAVALGFRLLRQRGFNVSEDVFDGFKNGKENGGFRKGLENDTEGLLSLYEASYLSTKSDSKLKEARSFATNLLKEFVGNGQKSYMSDMVTHALEMPYHWRFRRLEARWYIDVYEKKHGMNPVLLQFAKLDFNMVQEVHQEDLKYVSSYWSNSGMNKLEFARDGITQNYLWTLGFLYEPEFGYHRRVITKLGALISAIDDIYDVFGTLEELKLFTEVIERWDVNGLDKLPEYMRLCFLAIYNESNQIAYDVLRDKNINVIPHLRKAWKDLGNAYLKEAKWYKSGYKPSLKEYIENAWISVGLPHIILHLFCVLSDHISKDNLDSLSGNKQPIVQCSCTIIRLINDLATSPDEMARGDVPKSIQCYMNETGASEAEAREHVKEMISGAWEAMNRYKGETTSLPRVFVEAVVNLARTAHYIYQYGDGHGFPGKAKIVDSFMSLLVDFVPID